ncbi:MAG TPA: hypothetical protein GX500_02560 [Firmicutes bacterium]|nr:hypothetical protein [Candidatus Fermentithermobacillaceae bacterium]
MLEKLNNLDSRWMYLALVIVLVIPIIKPIGMSISVNKDLTQRMYDFIDSLPPGSLIMFDLASNSSSDTEITPMIYAVMEHMYQKGHKLLVAGQWSSGLAFWSPKIDERAREYGWVYGVDYVNIGYKAGGTSTWRAMGQDFWKGAMEVDINGTPFSELPIMQNIRKLDDKTIDCIVIFESGSPGMETWITYFPTIPLCKGSVAAEISSSVRYIPTGQLKGLIPGMRGAAEYEKLVNRPGIATQLMDAQSMSHLLVVALIALGNIAYFGTKRKMARGR